MPNPGGNRAKRYFIRWDKKVIDRVYSNAEKSLISLGKKIEKEAMREIKSQNIVDTGRLHASISTNWSGSGMSGGTPFRLALSGGQPFSNSFSTWHKDDAVGQPDSQSGKFTVVVGTKVPYAPHVEFGTATGKGPRPYLKKAFETIVAKWPDFFKNLDSGTIYNEYKDESWTDNLNF